MGVFDWLSGQKSKLELIEDNVWLSRQAKLQGIAAAIDACFSGSDPPLAVILAAQFDDCLAELQAMLEAKQLPGPVTATLVEELASISAAKAPLAESQLIEIVVAERHPLRSRDEAVLQFARSLPGRCRVTFHVSLEDPLMKLFAGEWVENLLRQLGLKEHEVIRSRLVTRRIVAAQSRIESNSRGNERCRSAQEWLERNCHK
jgi:hypothetical protein